ncbi:hypothetical protein CUMW_083730, partial [Citrus unshiu]
IPIQKESTVTKQSIIQVTKFHDDLKRHCNCATRIYINNSSYGKVSCHDDDGGGDDEDEETTKKMK